MTRSVSIIIPCYNSDQWLEKTLESCLQQDYVKEIIVVDDFSDDDSWKTICQYASMHPAVRPIKNDTKGGNNARNKGFAQSIGGYIQWLDADDQLLPGKLKAQVEYLENHKDVDIVYSDWRMDKYNRDGLMIESKERLNQQYDDLLYTLLANKWSTPSAYLLRNPLAKKLDDIKAWNPKRVVAQDREYFTLASCFANKAHYVPGVFSVYNRWSSQSTSQKPENNRLRQFSIVDIMLRVNAILHTNHKNGGYHRVIDSVLLEKFVTHNITPRKFIGQLDNQYLANNLPEISILRKWLAFNLSYLKKRTLSFFEWKIDGS